MKPSRHFSRRLVFALAAMTLMLSLIPIYYLRALLIPVHTPALNGPREGYYWSAAQYQIAYLQFQNEAVLYATGESNDAVRVRLRFDVLKSKFRLLSQPSELTSHFHRIPTYESAIATLSGTMAQLDRDMLFACRDPAYLRSLLDTLAQGWLPVTVIANEIRSLEMQQRDSISANFDARRDIGYINAALVAALLIVLAWLSLASYRQSLALKLEHKAVTDRQALLTQLGLELRKPVQSITDAVVVLTDNCLAPHHHEVIKRLENASRQLQMQMTRLADGVTPDADATESPHMPVQHLRVPGQRPEHEAAHVLVVDDCEFTRSVFRDLLEKLDIACDLACNAIDALQYLDQRSYAAILLDLDMPGMDGVMLAQELRLRSGLNRHAPLIAVRTHTPEPASPEPTDIFSACLLKPARLETLRMALNAVLQGHAANNI